MPETINVEELHRRFNAQGVSAREHVAVKCPMCSTVQSLASFAAVGVSEGIREKAIGYNCIGRYTNAGPPTKKNKPGGGCNWTLGGLFRLHKLEIATGDGKTHPYFEIAGADEAQALERQNTATPPAITISGQEPRSWPA